MQTQYLHEPSRPLRPSVDPLVDTLRRAALEFCRAHPIASDAAEAQQNYLARIHEAMCLGSLETMRFQNDRASSDRARALEDVVGEFMARQSAPSTTATQSTRA